MPSIPIQFTDEEWLFLLQNRTFSNDVIQALKGGKGALGLVSVQLDEKAIREIGAYAAQTFLQTKDAVTQDKMEKLMEVLAEAHDTLLGDSSAPAPSPINQGLKDMLESQEFTSKAEMEKAVQEYQDTYNDTPQDELGGFSPIQTSQLLNSQIDMPDCALKLNHELSLKEIESIHFIQNTRTFLRLMEEEGEVKATKKLGNLNRNFVEKLIDSCIIEEREREAMFRFNKVFNEEDYREGHIIRLLCEIAGLIKKRKDTFSITKTGSKYRNDLHAGALYTSLFNAHFCKFNLGYLDGYPDFPEIQTTIAFSLAAIKDKP